MLDSSGESSLPYPLRLFESSWCTVELLAAHKLDMDQRTSITESNYLTVLHWYGSDGSRHSLDMRKLIRHEMKKVSDFYILICKCKKFLFSNLRLW